MAPKQSLNESDTTVARQSYKDEYKKARDLNTIDRSYVQVIKQVNWNFSDGAPSNQQHISELKKAYTYTGRVVPNRLP